MKLPPLLPRPEVQARLLAIFPDGRSYCTRDIAGATVFAFLYTGAIEGSERFLGPKHVYKMSNDQAALTSDAERLSYGRECSKARFTSRGPQWYADNTREPIRDETLRQGLIPVGAVVERPGLPTNSPLPRYSMTKDFAALFDPKLSGVKLRKAIAAWQATNLSAAGLARITVVQAGRTKNQNISLTLPNGETRKLEPGPSAVITKHVVEVFAERFLEHPALIWVSESGKKVFESDDELKRNFADLAWNSFIWIASEPENIIAMYAGGMNPPRLHALLQNKRHIRRVNPSVA